MQEPTSRHRRCEYCKNPLASNASPLRRFCRPLCQERAKRGYKPPLNRRCQQCKTGIPDTAPPQQLYCSRPCKTKTYTQNHAEANRARAKAWRVDNPERSAAWFTAYRTANNEALRERQRRDYLANPMPWKNSRDRRRALIRANPATCVVTNADWQAILRIHGWRCAYCAETHELTVEHVIPISRGGRHGIGNLIPACGPCNKTKGSRFYMEWKRDKARATRT